MSSEKYHQAFSKMATSSKNAMSDLFMSGINDAGVWVRYGAVEDTVAEIVEAERKAATDTALTECKKKITQLYIDRCREHRAISHSDLVTAFNWLEEALK